ncbi:hypothetical protein [Actinomadura violacea]|uniref:Uncharacterized protein n=1 Tax=Actinomadura violacea TaxID=2819934 RepID=A0ABS3RLT2_9ACTN|nr:hypothetical protein [Actinomadura violacea]MBO2457045.1 hypothetical protein [Actinomadura violacea]
MRKIPTLFVRDWDGDPRHVTRVTDPSCAWVAAGEGRATRKYDGTCVRFDGARWHARREVKAGRPAPPGFVPLSEDPATGKTIGWEPAEQSAFWKHLRAALDAAGGDGRAPGTYELIGPKINGNPEGAAEHTLVPHGADDLGEVPRDHDGLAAWLHAHPYEGIVFWRDPADPACAKAKIKRRDFPTP